MTVLTTDPIVKEDTPRSGSGDAVGWVQRNLPKLVLSPSLAVILFFVYGFILWTIYLSFSASRILPN